MSKSLYSKFTYAYAIAFLSLAWGICANAQTLQIPLCNGSTTSLSGVTMKLHAKDFGSAVPWEYDISNGLTISLTKGIKYDASGFTAYACPGGFTINCVTKVYYSLSPTAALASKPFTINIHEDGASKITTQDILNIQYYPELNGPLTSPINTSLAKMMQLTKYALPPPSTDFYYVGTGKWNNLAVDYWDKTGPAYSGVVNFILPAHVNMPPAGTHHTLLAFSTGLVAPTYTKGCIWASPPVSITFEQ